MTDPTIADDRLNRDLGSATEIANTAVGTVTRLFARINDGDTDAEDELFRLTCGELANRAAHLLVSFPGVLLEPNEVINEVYPKLARALAQHDLKDRDHFFAIAYRNFRWFLLDRTMNPSHPVLEDQRVLENLTVDVDAVSEQIAQLEDARQLWKAVGRLPDRDSTLIHLKHTSDLSFEQIGEMLGCAKATAHDWYHCACARLREELGIHDG